MTAPMKSGIVAAAVAALITFPLVAVKKSPGGATGTDDQATSAIQTLAPAYTPWFTSIFTPGADSLLFALQASLGAAFIGYYAGYSVRRTRDNATKPGIKRAH